MPSQAITSMLETLTDLIDRRGAAGPGFNDVRFLELSGATMVEMTQFEPDPRTFRGEYYYNTSENRLYKKIITSNKDGIVTAHWQGVSNNV